VIKIKKLYIFIIIIIAVTFTGCAPEAEPVSAASDLQARFESMFEDSEEPVTADGTVRFGDITEPPAEPTADIEETTTESMPEITEIEIIPEPPEETTELLEDMQEEVFVVTPSGRRYHVEGCRHARNVHEYLTREEAESKGYDPCRTCNP